MSLSSVSSVGESAREIHLGQKGPAALEKNMGGNSPKYKGVKRYILPPQNESRLYDFRLFLSLLPFGGALYSYFKVNGGNMIDIRPGELLRVRFLRRVFYRI